MANTTKGGGIPPSDKPVIKAMTTEAQDARTAGAQGEEGKHPPGSEPRNIPAPFRDAIVPPPGWHVP